MPSISPSVRSSGPWGEMLAPVPRRGSLISWTLRIAQVADRLVARAFSASPLAREHCESLLAEKTLVGWERCCRLIPGQQGVLAVERARLQLNKLLRSRAERYQRFLQLRQAMVGNELSSGAWDTADIHLNPICSWVRIAPDAVGDRDGEVAGSVLFFAADQEVRGLRMNLEGQVLMNELADYYPCTASQWADLSCLADLRQLRAFVRHLADLGLVAVQCGE